MVVRSYDETGEHRLPDDSIGRVEQRVIAGEEMRLRHNKPSRLIGHIRPEFIEVLSPGTILIASTRNDDSQGEKVFYVCGLPELSGGINVVKDVYRKPDPYIRVKAILDPKKELIEYQDGRVELSTSKFRWADLQPIYFPKGEQLRAILGLPKEGASLGFAMAPNGSRLQRVPYYHPIHDGANGYTGYFVVGKQGRGKTTLGRVIAKSFSEWRNPPAIVVLDGEGEYLELLKKNPNLNKLGTELLGHLGLNSPCKDVHVYQLSNDRNKGTHTLSISKLRGKDVPAFLPELPDKSKLELEDLCREVFEEYWRFNRTFDGLTFQEFIRRLENRVYSHAMHFSQRKAINRALQHAPLNIFDQGGEPLDPKEMLHPGRISVISDVGFSEDEQGFVGLYILHMLGRLKIDERLDDIGVVLMIDEATRRFPAYSDYLRDRVAKEINGMLHVGRKRSFMPVIMTQYPDDVPREIRDSCGVQVVFQVNIAGNASWLKQRLRPYRDLIDTLPVGEALVDSVAHNEPVHLCVPPSPVMEKPEVEKE